MVGIALLAALIAALAIGIDVRFEMLENQSTQKGGVSWQVPATPCRPVERP